MIQLPHKLLLHVSSFLPIPSLLECARVCRQWKLVTEDEWKNRTSKDIKQLLRCSKCHNILPLNPECKNTYERKTCPMTITMQERSGHQKVITLTSNVSTKCM